ncbi:YgdI/YgdR family lipoprotein [Bordetella sp. BOR01]|uniref:YgdI/YgdR family lipoprotein n=1 Tax=Bordetella sp. BOR01 TaxID=2854779 RepID=UPI001C476C0E|nr:YgdI/YgdR family lipoprotein [Bordetella sp. BOR01]MBV7485692.1 YgdI/YgdR family lipoprotein [Bordetella sp. BOR01]
MNLKTTTLALIVTGVGVLAGCSTPSTVHTRDGSQVFTADKPQYNEDTGFYEYEKDGQKVQVNKDDVKSIEEVK